MNIIKATWKDGRIIPREAVDWPDGCEVLVEPVAVISQLGIQEVEWRDDPESIADWDVWISGLQPFEYTADEDSIFRKFDAEMRQFNLEAVRRSMSESSE